jgi:hypothetical protein
VIQNKYFQNRECLKTNNGQANTPVLPLQIADKVHYK